MATAADSFDYVIVGAGAAGSVLANRLTADGTTTVCVLEAGPPDRNPWIHIPAGFIKTLADPGVTWQFKTEPLADDRRPARSPPPRAAPWAAAPRSMA